MKTMKKYLWMLAVASLLIVSGAYTYVYAYTPQSCSTVSGASVTAHYATSGGTNYYVVTLANQSGSRCSASGDVYGKVGGSWEKIGSFYLTADHGKRATEWIDLDRAGASAARLEGVSTWRCN